MLSSRRRTQLLVVLTGTVLVVTMSSCAATPAPAASPSEVPSAAPTSSETAPAPVPSESLIPAESASPAPTPDETKAARSIENLDSSSEPAIANSSWTGLAAGTYRFVFDFRSDGSVIYTEDDRVLSDLAVTWVREGDTVDITLGTASTWTGTISGDTITGTYTVPGFAPQPFDMTKVME